MRAYKQTAVQFYSKLFISAVILLILSACKGSESPGSHFISGDPDDIDAGSDFITGDPDVIEEFCNSPWLQPGPNCGVDGQTPRVLPVCAGDQPGIIDALVRERAEAGIDSVVRLAVLQGA